MLAAIRQFFAERQVLEVETPILSRSASTDAHLEPVATSDGLYLHTSPEHAMKRLLAAGFGDIYQICKAFRAGEEGRLHNPEFTMLEWYRVGFDDQALLSEVEELLALLLKPVVLQEPERLSYAEALSTHAGVAVDSRPSELVECLRDHGVHVPGYDGLPETEARSLFVDLVMSAIVAPRLGNGRLSSVYDYPPDQAALARITDDPTPLARRFETWFSGVELANGFDELTDASEQASRFETDLERRRRLGRRTPPVDALLIDALSAGLPASAGVAFGLDRVLMLSLQGQSLNDVLHFPISRA